MRHRLIVSLLNLLLISAVGLGFTGLLQAAKPSAPDALKLTPIQKEVDFETPSAKEMEKCTIKGESSSLGAGWVIYNEAGQLLRRFLDTNRDNRVDLWCYFKDGVEVYRDRDSDYNGKADRYRWLGTAGTKWGVDQDEDGRIDRWKMISPEEVSAEIVAAIRDKDKARFRRVLLTLEEIKSLGLDEAKQKELAGKVQRAESSFNDLVGRQKVLGRSAKWLHFGGSQPGIVPAGANGASKDLTVYENVAAIADNGGSHAQISIGTLIRLGDVWKVIDAPGNLAQSQTSSVAQGFFFHAPGAGRSEAGGAGGGLSEATQKLMAEYERLEKALNATNSSKELAQIHKRRADVLYELARDAKEAKEQVNWMRQYADVLSLAVQSGGYPDGLERLQSLHKQLSSDKNAQEMAAYAKFRHLTAEYALSVQNPKGNFAKVQKAWLEKLEGFVDEYPRSSDAAEAILQIAIAKEFAGEEDKAKMWYTRILRDFSTSPLASKAAGAKQRLESVGKTISLRGVTLDNKTVDLSNYRGRLVLLHYWATWCEPCKNDLKEIQNLLSKYNRNGFHAIGVSLDSQRSTLVEYMASHRMPWPQLYEDGGLDSRLANEMGILTLPTMLLIDEKGRVVSRNIHIGELENELSKRFDEKKKK